MIKIAKKNTSPVIEFVFDSKGLKAQIIKEFGHITFGVKEDTGYFYTGKALEAKDAVKEIAAKLVAGAKLDFQVDVKSLLKETKIDEAQFVDELVHAYAFAHGKIYTVKKSSNKKSPVINLLTETKTAKDALKEAKILADARTDVRSLQVTPPNILNSVVLADKIVAMFDKVPNIKVTVLDKKKIKANKMGLLLSVNKGSAHDARVVIMEYKGAPTSKEKTAFVGKGITFDSGGYNIKTGKFMIGMKYDMSGSVIVAGAMQAISKLKPKKNIVGVMAITDNVVSNAASLPDSVYTGMNGTTVEVNNTDAEGRLVLADALTYSAKKLNATRIVDVATLTGAVVSALGSTYTGAWSTTEKGWKDISAAAESANENVWRMPLHKDYLKFMQGSKVADLKNTDFTGKGGSSSAAMFLTKFVEGVEYIHLDVAGTADVSETPMAPMVKTLVELAKQK